MLKFTSYVSGTLVLLLAVAPLGFGQETPAPAEEEEPKEPRALRHFFTFGAWSNSGNVHFERYGRPPYGFIIQEARFSNPAGQKFPFGFVGYRGAPGLDNVQYGTASFNGGKTTISGNRLDSGSYVFDWRPRGLSQFTNQEVVIDHRFSKAVGGFFSYRNLEWTGRYPAPRENDETRNEMIGAGAAAQVLGGTLDLRVSSRRTVDVTGAQPVTQQRRYEASFTRDLTDRFSVEGILGYGRIEQVGQRESSVRNFNLAGVWDLTPTTGLHFSLLEQKVELPNVQNARIRRRLMAQTRLTQRWKGWSMQLAYRQRDIERIRADQSFVDIPRYNDYEARISGKVGPARLTMRGTWEDLARTAQFQTLDPRQLIWDDRATLQTKLDGGNELFGLYAVHTRRFQQNRQRDVKIDWDNFVVGGSYVLNPNSNAFAEIASDDFRARGSFGAGTRPLDFYFPNARTATMGLNWTPNPTTFATIGINLYENGDLWGEQLTMTLRRSFARDHELSLVFAPWRQNDRQFDIAGYRSTVASAQYTVRF